MKTPFFAAVAAVIAPSFTAAAPQPRQPHDCLTVELSKVSPTEVKAVLENCGSEGRNFNKYGTFMDEHPVQVCDVFQDGVEVDFTGIEVKYYMQDLPMDAFFHLGPGEKSESTINIPAIYNVREGDISISCVGAIPHAASNSTEIIGSTAYDSNILDMTLSQEDIAIVPRAYQVVSKRTNILESCDGEKGQEFRDSLQKVAGLANRAATAARTGDVAKFEEYFKTTDDCVRENVALRFEAIEREASSTTSGATTYSCTDQYGSCGSGVLAYARFDSAKAHTEISNCPLFYTLPSIAKTCERGCQASCILHEFSHAPQVFSPPAKDYAYGYESCKQLTADQAWLNADTYALYATAIDLSCDGPVKGF